MKQLFYTSTILLITALGAQAASGQQRMPAGSGTGQSLHAAPWTDLAVGVMASYHRGQAFRSARASSSELEDGDTEPARITRSRRKAVLHTSGQEAGTAQDYLLVPPERAPATPVWLSDLYSLRESMQRSTTYEGPGVWMGLDPMGLSATLKLEIEKVINVLD